MKIKQYVTNSDHSRTIRYQVTVPEDVRKLMKIKTGQTLVFAEDDGKIILKTEI